MTAALLTVVILAPWFTVACKVWTRLSASDRD